MISKGLEYFNVKFKQKEELVGIDLKWKDLMCSSDPVMNGEAAIFNVLSKVCDFKCVFDVGASGSRYPLMRPGCDFHLFEPEPTELMNLKINYQKFPRVYVNRFRVGTLSGNIRIDDYCRDRGIEKIDFLKIDVDGNDFDVLMSARRMLEEGRVDNIQIEYGKSNSDDGVGWGQKYSLSDLFDAFSHWNIYNINMRGIHCVYNAREVLSASKRDRETDDDYIYHNFLVCRDEVIPEVVNEIYSNTISSRQEIDEEEFFYIVKRIYGSIEAVLGK